MAGQDPPAGTGHPCAQSPKIVRVVKNVSKVNMPWPAHPIWLEHSLAQLLPPPACSHTQPAEARGPAQGRQGYVASTAQWPWPAWPGLRGAPCTHSAAPSRPVGRGGSGLIHFTSDVEIPGPESSRHPQYTVWGDF